MPPPSQNPPRRRPPDAGGKPRVASRPAGPRLGARRPVESSERLIVLEGPATGQTFRLEGDEVVIGRSNENQVSITDTSVSRKHAVVRRVEGAWALSDLGSGNGTFLNGAAVDEETVLSDGDVITLGDTQLRFTTGGGDTQETEGQAAAAEVEAEGSGAERGLAVRASRPPVRTSRSAMAIERANPRGRPVRARGRALEEVKAAREGRRKVLLSIGGAAVAILALLVGWKAIEAKRRMQDQAATQAVRAHLDQMGEMFKEAKSLVKQGRWGAAKEKLEVIQATDPDYEPQQIARYVENAVREIPNEAAIAQAKAALASGELGAAAEALKSVKETPQSETPLRLIRETLDARVADRLAEGRTLAMARDLASATKLKALAEDLVRARPDDRDANALLAQAVDQLRVLTAPVQVVATQETPWVEVQQRFRTGDATGALSLAQACGARQARCRELEQQIHEWTQQSKQVEALSETELIALFELDRRIAGGTSSEQSGAIRTQLVSRLFVKASQAKTTGNWSRATEYAHIVLKAAPDHHGAQALVQEAKSQAREVYLRGYQLMETNPDEAIRLFKDVMSMTPVDDEYHQKAKARLAELQSR